MRNCNNSIKCDVCMCKHNVEGVGCSLDAIKVTTDCTDCTCCGSYSSKDQD